VLIPAPAELGPRTLGRRVVVATLAALAAAMVTTAALLVAQPPDLIPSGGEPGRFASGARPAEAPSSTQAGAEPDRQGTSRPDRPAHAETRAATSRAASRHRRFVAVATPAGFAGGACAAPIVAAVRAASRGARPAAIAAQSP
jgi:hypothetical protein